MLRLFVKCFGKTSNDIKHFDYFFDDIIHYNYPIDDIEKLQCTICGKCFWNIEHYVIPICSNCWYNQ